MQKQGEEADEVRPAFGAGRAVNAACSTQQLDCDVGGKDRGGGWR
jgi:hypothetical protein